MDNFENNYAPFGLRKVKKTEKVTLVNDIFDRVANKYDLMNDAMSIFQHRIWKRIFINNIILKNGTKALDVSCGTGDIAYRLYKKSKRENVLMDSITLLDPCKAMLKKAKDRFLDKGLVRNFSYIESLAEKLPFKDKEFDIYTISFGLRNVTDRKSALLESIRVLKNDGKFYCLEFSQLQWPGIDKLYNLYSSLIIPRLGKYLVGDKESYQYLVESIQTFPSQKQLVQELVSAGYKNVSHQSLAGGIVTIYTGTK